MNSTTHLDERIKLHEVAFVTGLVVFVAVSYSITFTCLATRCYVVDLIDHMKTKRKGGRHAP